MSSKALSVCHIRSFICLFVWTDLVTTISHERLDETYSAYSLASDDDLIDLKDQRSKSQ